MSQHSFIQNLFNDLIDFFCLFVCLQPINYSNCIQTFRNDSGDYKNVKSSIFRSFRGSLDLEERKARRESKAKRLDENDCSLCSKGGSIVRTLLGRWMVTRFVFPPLLVVCHIMER